MSPTEATMDWQGITLSVSYHPSYFGIGVHHLELRVIAPENAIIPVTETGYRSHFFNDDVEQYGGPLGYVRTWLDEAAQSAAWQHHVEAARQLKLF
jgi:hypothetical protein